MLATDINYADALLLTDKITAILSLFLLLGIAPGIWLVLWFLSKLSEMDRQFRLLNVVSDKG
ncbi:hypothetical protein C7B70_20425 [Chlorogloea sp. CCALA 695]|nr:hypothetical protein C7B70_20425 [Chlorogloea sp. CCALA 695]